MLLYSPKFLTIARNTLGKSARLKHRKQIDALFKTGKTIVSFPYRLYFRESAAMESQSPQVLFGVGVSKRYFKKAIDRNRIKRLTREVYRHRQHSLNAIMAAKNNRLDLFIIFTGKELPTLPDCEHALETGLDKLSRIVRPKP
ncbi:ribonuclease P protein component [Flavihumibacter fluvii]|uniref:ribonuclease P protein component n=1 Tax=Flavihumibacter fluvii TaxID=2838157 RepID=UPI001BDE4E42|nr:ribonuclease P protein component [Flavihumibacter fluvii]ULQ52275.1 ribonuclease P protein component [Flavihumibacter fluvii]